MSIAIVSLQFEKTSTGGGGVHVENITEQFLKQGQKVTILSIHTDKTLDKKQLRNDWRSPYSIEDRGNLQVVRFLIDEGIENPYVGDKETEFDRILRFADTVNQWIRDHLEDYQVISLHGHHIIPGWLAKQLSKTGRLVTSTIHALESTYVSKSGESFGNFEATEELMHKLRYWESMAVYADYIIINSHKVRSDFIEIATDFNHKLEDFEYKLVLISSGVTSDFLMSDKEVEDKLKEKPEVIKMLTFSRVDQSKGHDFAIKAAKIAARETKDKLQLTITGIPESDEYVEKLKELAKDTPENLTIKFDFKTAISPVEEKKEILDDKHIYMLPSLQEPFGMSIIEASARGCMVISNDTTGPVFMFEADKGQETEWGYITKYGALAKRTDDYEKNLPGNLAKAIVWTIENFDTGAQRVIAFNQRVRKLWTWEGIAQQYLDLFHGKNISTYQR